MLHDSHGLHHFHKRKRIHENHEPYPHPDKLKNFMDKVIYFVAMIGPALTIPQLYNIWVLKTAAGVSIISWSAYLFCATMWLIYGILHKEKPIIFVQIVWIILDIFIITGIGIYS